MASNMVEALIDICKKTHLDEFYILDRLEQTLAKNYADILHLDYGARVTIDRATGKVYVYELVPKGEPNEETGEYEDFDEKDVTPKEASRLVVQHVKQELAEIIRNSSRQQIYEEFSKRIGDLITGTVLQTTSEFAIIKIRDGVEAELPYFDLHRHQNERNERPPHEYYAHNQRLHALIVDVRNPNSDQPPVRGERQRPSIVVSRSRRELISRLFELEVPEIYDGIVTIRSVARDAGVRSKIAVSSADPHLDPVGACVGPKGSRVRNVVAELRGERVDVVPWSDDPAQNVASALSPARVSRVLVDQENNHATVIVPDDQLSLAIGKGGQNARLAASLTGMHIDIKNESLAKDILKDLAIPDLTSVSEDELRCAYETEQGQCRNLARPGSRFCGLHDGMSDSSLQETSSEPISLI